MKTIQTICDIPNATAIDLGPLSELKDYELELGPGVKIPGKVFGGAPVKAGGADFSFQVFAPGTEGGFYHVHKDHEELYFFLAGEGQYQVDGTNIPVKEGSVVRVAPAGEALRPAFDAISRRFARFLYAGLDRKESEMLERLLGKTLSGTSAQRTSNPERRRSRL